MKIEYIGLACVCAVAIVGITMTNLERIESKRMEFAKECNASGKTARMIDGMLQCVKSIEGAQSAEGGSGG